MNIEASSIAYDDIPYPTHAQSQTHPERLASLGILHGLDPVPVGHSRILELGCGDAGNLAPLAAAFPGSRCTGIDLSGTALERGRELARLCGIRNLELHQMDLAAPRIPAGEYDYIICHGLYAWVPEAAREGILQVCQERLAPNGLALVSYNALPGACVRQEIRNMVRWHVRGLTDPGERLVESRALVAFLSGAMLDTDEIRLGFRAELQVALEKDPGFFFHDELSEDYAPVYFHEFMAAAGRHGLQFVADADPAELVLLRLSDETRRLIAALSDDRLEQQQYLDFVVGRRFRHTILCRADGGTPPGLRIDQVARCWFSSQGNLINPEKINVSGGVAVFERPGGLKLETDFLPGKLALQFLGEIAPARVTFVELVQQTRARLTSLGGSSDWTEKFDADFARFLLEACVPRVAVVHGANPEISGTPGEHPVAFRVARVQAAAGPFVTSAYHNRVRLDERWSREFIARADGTRTLEQLANEIETLVSKDAGVDAEVWRKVRADLPAALALLARQGLIIA